MGRSDKGKQKYFIFGLTMFAIPFCQNCLGFHAILSCIFTTLSRDCEL